MCVCGHACVHVSARVFFPHNVSHILRSINPDCGTWHSNNNTVERIITKFI